MKGVIKNQKKMKNTMYIVFGVFALALFGVTMWNPSYASEGLMIDDALDAIMQGTEMYGSGGFEKVEEEKLIQPVEDNECEDVVEPELAPDERLAEGDEIPQDLDDVNLEGDDEYDKENEEVSNGVENNENETISEEDKETTKETEKIEEEKNEDNNLNQGNHGVSNENIDNEEEIDSTNLGDFEFSKMDNPNLRILNGNEFTVTYHPNGGAFSGMGINEIKEYKYETDNNGIKPIYNTKIPNRESEDISQQSGWMFAGWYTKSGDNNDWGEEFDLSNPNSSIAYAKWLPFNDLNVKIGDYTITIMDRNLGALQTAEGDYFGNGSYENSNKLGNLYQFGNSYGFKNIPNTFVANSHSQGNKITIPEEIEPLGENDNYYSFNIFIKIANRWYEGNHKNLWGADDITNNDNERKGPCPTGYHIPSQDERKIIYNTLIKTNGCTGDLEQKGKCIAKKLRLPYAGKINIYSPNNGKIMNQGSDGYYLNSRGGRMTFDNSSVYPEAGGAEAQGGSIRCFKDHNLSKEIKFDTNGGEFNDGEKIQDIEYQRIGQIYEPQEYLKIPVKTGWMFAGWYTTSGDGNWGNQTEEIDIELASNTTAYAKWLPFNDLDLGIIGLEGIKIMDRNLGAEGVATGILYNTNQGHEDYDRLGYYYQRGNSYGFDTKNNLSYTNNIKINGSLFGPQMNYYSYIYKQINDNSISYISNDRSNVWGGKETLNNDEDKQGPCPIGYHVPDKDEFNAIINKFNTLKENEGFCNNTNEKECFAEKLKLPFAGYKGTNYSSYGSEGNYWTSSPSGSYTYKLWVNSLNLNVGATTDTNLYSIRCFKNNDKPIIFQTNGGNKLEGEYYTLRRRENKENKITLPGIGVMEKDGYTFEGWYSTSGFEEGTEVTNNDITTNNDEITLYAKWKKNPEITLKSNGGKFENGEEEKIIKANKIVEKKLINDEYSNKTVRKVVVFTGAESIHLSGSGLPTCNYGINIYNCDKEKNNECNIYKTINANCGSKGCFITNEDIPGDTITIEAETGTCNATPKFNFTTISNGINYYEITDEIPNIQRNGYEFQGWYEENSNSKYNIEETPIAEDKTFYAKWNANTYTVSFNADNGEANPVNITVNYDSRYPKLPVVNKTGYTFSGWYNGAEMVSSGDIVKITEDVTLKAKRKMNQYKIIFDTDGGNEINPIEKDYNSVINITLPTPTKECNEFSGWDVELPETMPAHDITLKAIWNYTCSRSSGGGGAKKSETTTREIAIDTNTENEHNSANEKENEIEISEEDKTTSNDETSNQVISVTQEVSEDGTVEAVVETIKIRNTDIIATVRTEVNPSDLSSSSSNSTTHTKEQNDAYSFAKSNGITTTQSIEDAKMNTELTRIQMAKMLSNFAINVLGQEPDTEKGIVKFDDVTNKMDKQYDNAVTKAYQLGIMGQNVKNNEFRPNDEVTRAEFASSLSRLLYHTEEGEYKGTGKYYIPHIAKLYNEGIINKADPKIKEKRGYVMTMLKRTVD